MTTKLFHISGDTVRDPKTMLLVPRTHNEERMVDLVCSLLAQREDEDKVVSSIKNLSVGEYVVTVHVGVVFRVA